MIGLGGNATLGIGLAVHLRDHFSANARRIEGSMMSLQRTSNKVLQGSLSSLRNTGLGVAAVGLLGIRAMTGWVKSGMEFEHIMKAVQAVTGSTDEQLGTLTNKALALAGKTVFTLNQVGGAMKYLGMAGFSVSDIDKTIEAVTALGAATDTAIEGKGGAGDMMTNMMTAFNLTPEQAMRVANTLSVATTSANIDIGDLHESLKYAASDLTTLGISFEESTAIMAVLGNAGIQGSIAGTAVGNMLRKLTTAMDEFATKKQGRALERLGISKSDVVDAKGNMKSLVSIIDTLFRAGGKGNVKALNTIQALTGVRGARALIPLMRKVKMGMSFRGMTDLLQGDLTGKATSIAAKRMEDLTGASLKLSSAWSGFTYHFEQALAPALTVIVKWLTKLVNLFSKIISTRIGKVIVILGAALVVAGTAAGIFAFVLGTVGLAITSVSGGFAAMRAAGLWAWNAMTAAVFRYTAASKAAEWFGGGIGGGVKGAAKGAAKKSPTLWKLIKEVLSGSGVSFAAGRYAKGSVVGGRKVGGQFAGKIASKFSWLLNALSKIVPILSRFKSGIGWAVKGVFTIGRAANLAGWVLLALESQGIGLFDIFKGLVHAIGWAISSIGNIIMNPISFATGGQAYRDAQAKTDAEYFNYKVEGVEENKLRLANVTAGNIQRRSDEFSYGDRILGSQASQAGKDMIAKQTVVIINLDGEEKHKEVIQETHEEALINLGINL